MCLMQLIKQVFVAYTVMQTKSDYLPEIKQFISFYNIHFHYQKRMTDTELILKTKMAQLYQLMLIDPKEDNLEHQLINLLQDHIMQPSLPSNIIKAALRTIKKLLEHTGFRVAVSKQGFSPSKLLKSLYACQFETHDQDQEEVILLIIQKIVIRIAEKFFLELESEENKLGSFKYFFKVLKKRALSEVAGVNGSMHMREGTKRNMNVLFSLIMQKEESQRAIKQKILQIIFRKMQKHVQKLQKPNLTTFEIAASREYIISLFKAMNDCIQSVFGYSNDESKWLLEENCNLLMQFTCTAAENQELVVKNLAQQFFAILLKKILELKLALREEVEVMFVKVALKPLSEIETKRKPKSQGEEVKKISEQNDILIFSDHEDSESSLKSNAQTNENDYSIQADGHSSQSLELDMNLSFLLELLLCLSPKQIAQFYLLYDCQPFSENIIGRSMTLLIKLSQLQGQNGNINQCYHVISMILKSLSQVDSQNFNVDQCQRGIYQIGEMIENKNQTQQIVRAANDKPKKFYSLIEENFDQIDEEISPRVASKVLLYSRRVLIDKIAEIFGGKDDKSKRCLEQYLHRQDYSTNHIQDSLRSFMQTFRMAGIDSQVVFRILEHFSFVYYSHDKLKTFISQEEAYEFTYLIIVLQTCQHNPSIKDKTSLERFMGQALAIVPQSFATLPQGFVEDVFNKVTSNEIKAPVTRDMIKGFFESQIFDEIKLRLINSSKQASLSETEFVSTSDLTQRQLYEYNNYIDGVAPPTLEQAALKHIVSLITAKFCQLNAKQGESKFSQFKKFDLTKQLIQANQVLKNGDWVDRLLIDLDKQVNAINRIQKLENERKVAAFQDLQSLFWSNFVHLKLSVVLLPKLAPNLLGPNEGVFHYASFNAVEYKIRSKFNQKGIPEKQLLTSYQEQAQLAQAQQKAGDPAQGTGGLFSIVYNYFADTNAPQEEQKKRQDNILSGQHDCESLKQILDTFNLVRLVNVVKNTQHVKPVEQQDEQQPAIIKLAGFLENKGITLEMTLDLLFSFAKENLQTRKTILCLEFIKQIYDAARSFKNIQEEWKDRFKKLNKHILTQFKSLIQIIVRPQSQFPAKEPITPLVKSNSRIEDKQETRSETDSFDRLSTKSDQLSYAETPTQNLALHFLKPPVFSQLDQTLCEQINKHMILEIYFDSAKDACIESSEIDQVVKDIHKTLQAIVEEDLTKDQFEEAFLLQQITNLLQLSPNQHLPIRRYAKLPKLLRLITILMIQSNSEACNKDNIQTNLLQLLNAVTSYFGFIQPTPFDQINLCLDSVMLKQSQKTVGILLESNHLMANKLLNLTLDICASIFSALEIHNQSHKQDSASFEVWFKVLKVIQSRVLLSPYASLFLPIQERACNMIKTQILSFQFQATVDDSCQVIQSNPKKVNEVELGSGIAMSSSLGVSPQAKGELLKLKHKEIKSQAKRIFQEILFEGLAFEKLEQQYKLLKQLEFFKGSFVQTQIVNQWDDEMEGFAQLCCLTVNTMTDVFIYYSTSLQDVSNIIDEKESEIQIGENFEMFSLLWLNFMRVLLYYAEEATSLSQNGNYAQSSVPLQQSVHDSIQRTMDFLVNENILVNSIDDSDLTSSFVSDSSAVKESLDFEKKKLYKTSCDVIGQYWQQPVMDHFKRTSKAKEISMTPRETETENQTQYQI